MYRCLVLTFLLASCAEADAPRTFQGVVEHERVEVAFEVAGKLAVIDVERGDSVAQGGELARLDAELAGTARQARAAEVAALGAELALLRAGTREEEVRATAARLAAAKELERIAEAQLARQKTLVASGAAPAASIDVYRQQLSQAQGERRSLGQNLLAQRNGARPEQIAALEARLAAAEAALAAEDERLARHTLRSPLEGVVVDRYLEPGEVVAAGAPVVAIADVTHPYVDVFVPQQDLEGVRTGLHAELRVDALEARFAGEVEHVWPTTEFTPRYLFNEDERQTLVVRVRLRVDDPERRLPAGVPAFATLAR